MHGTRITIEMHEYIADTIHNNLPKWRNHNSPCSSKDPGHTITIEHVSSSNLIKSIDITEE